MVIPHTISHGDGKQCIYTTCTQCLVLAAFLSVYLTVHVIDSQMPQRGNRGQMGSNSQRCQVDWNP